jgi:hypothetical protein
MANTNPGGVDLNTSPYFDDYDEDKKFVRVLYVPGRAVQARELTQMQTLQQVQTRRFANYFFKQGSIIDGCDQQVDLSLDYVKLQANYNGSEVDVTDFEDKIVYGANSGLKAYCGIVSDIEGTDPKTLFINYLSTGSIVLTVNNAATTITPGNTITFSTGNSAIVEASYIDPVTSANKILVSSANGTLTVTTANTIDSTGATIPLNVTAINDKRANTAFDNNETIFTANVTSRAHASSATTRATSTVVNEGLATEKTYTKGSKITVTDGIIYLADHFVDHTSQTLILDKYTNEPSYKIGIVPNKTFVDYIQDSTLVDNAQGTPNFQAPGADRFKIDTVLTKVALNETTDENEFITFVEVENGITKKKKISSVENKLEEELALRTSEESGDYSLSDPFVSVREHLLQGNNGGRFSTAEGGNNSLLLLEVDPFTAYVSGFRNQIIVQTPVELTKGLTTQFVEQTKTQINLGQYLEIKEMVGAWDFMEGTKVDLYDDVQEAITNGGFSSQTLAGSQIGEARVRAIEYVSGIQGTADARFHLYIYEISMNSGKTISQAKSIYDSATPNRIADIVVASGSAGAIPLEQSFNSMVFNLPYNAIQTIRDDQQNIETGFRFKKRFSVTFTNGLATIATTDSSETFVGTSILSATQKNEFYMVVVNNGGADVETGTLTGTVSVSSGTVAVTGVGTAFTTELNAGDVINIASEQISVSTITNDTTLTLASNHSAGASGVTYTKILHSGRPLSLTSYGGDGSIRSVDVSSPGTVVIDVKENATFTADVITTMDRTNAREKRKTLVFQATVNVNPSTYPVADTNGAYLLGYADVYQIHAIYQSADFSTPATTSDTNVTSSYTLDNGQRDYAYEYGRITPNAGVVPTGRLLVVFDHFTHDTTQGVGYCSVDSYPVNDTTTSNTTINTADIPTFTSPTTKKVFNLRDSIDFRPIKTANTSLNPIDVGTYQVPTGGLHFPKPNSDFDADLIYFKGRISKVFINSRGTFGINDGVPAGVNQLAKTPPRIPDTLEIAEISVPPYPSQPKDVKIRLLKNRRFTMKDISKINDRVKNLEYFTMLVYLEKQATDKTITDTDGIDRFKNGILVDTFAGHSVEDVRNPDTKSSIDKINRYLTCIQDNANVSGMAYNSTTSTTSKATGNKVFLNYSTQEAIDTLTQPFASRQLRLAEELATAWNGDMRIYPYADNWIETGPVTAEKTIVFDDTKNSDNWAALAQAWNTEVSPLNVHFLNDTQDVDVGRARDVQVGNQIVTRQTVNQTQTAFNQLVTVNRNEATSTTADFVTNLIASIYMRSRDFVIHATGLKNNAIMYAFFDGVDVTSNCKQIRLIGSAIQTGLEFDNDGILQNEGTDWETIAIGGTDDFIVSSNEIYILFRVPAETFYVGQREFKLTDSATNGTALTSAKTSLFAQFLTQNMGRLTVNSRPTTVSFTDQSNIRNLGRQVVNTFDRDTNVRPVPRNPDPVAQSFFVDPETFPEGFYLSSIDLYFSSVPSGDTDDANLGVRVDIREMINGYPSPEIVGTGDGAYLKSTQINTSASATVATTFTFANPIYLSPGNEYCFTMKPDGNDEDFAIWVAELGAVDITNPELDTIIPPAYGAGVLFTSANDRTWSARQNLDAKFLIRCAIFDTTTTSIAYLENKGVTTARSYDAIQPIFGDQILPGTNIKYEIKTADSSFTVDEDYTEIKNYERFVLPSRKQISTSADETSNSFKSLQVRATLSTTNRYVSPYIDAEKTDFAISRNVINNSLSTAVDGTVEYASGTSVVFGTGTDFANDVFAGEYVNFGNDQYRRIQSITNNNFLTVSTNFTASNTATQTITIRNEENPSGPYSSESRYITRIVTLNDGFEAADLVVYLNVNRPPGTGIRVYGKFLNENDTDNFDDKFYTLMSLDGTETFTLDTTQYVEEKYIVPTTSKTGGAELLNGTVLVSTANTNVEGTSTRFLQELRIGDTIGVGATRTERTVTTIANNTFLTVDSAFASTASGQDIYRILNNEVVYTTPDDRTFSGFKYFAVKILFISSSEIYAPKVKDFRAIALA